MMNPLSNINKGATSNRHFFLHQILPLPCQNSSIKNRNNFYLQKKTFLKVNTQLAQSIF